MKLKLDENLPSLLDAPLKSLGHDVHTVADEGLAGASDEALWRITQAEQRFLLTQDMGFADARKFPAGSHFGILIIRLGDLNLKLTALVDSVTMIFKREEVENWIGGCVVATEQKVRVTRPPNSGDRQ